MIKAENALSLRITDTNFDSNKNTYVRSEGSPTFITSSSFTRGDGSNFVSVSESDLIITDAKFADNEDSGGKGLGINCEKCTLAKISDSYFQDLIG